MTNDVGIVGATGYTGSELTRILVHHDEVNLRLITSRSYAGKKISDIHPYFEGICDMELSEHSLDDVLDLDLVFLALPHGVSMEFIKEIGLDGPKIVDLSGDCRLGDKDTYEQWYGKKHVYSEAIKKAVYGLPEVFREDIVDAQLVANPGCYPTSSILALNPAIQNGLVELSGISVDSKSGVTGAGAKPNKTTHFPRANEDFRAYKAGVHRHTPEMEEVLSNKSGEEIQLLFTPHLIPLNRGILTTVYCKAADKVSDEKLMEVYKETYKKEPFVRVRDKSPNVQAVRGSNYCDVYPKMIERTKQVILISAIDNLVKGAAGQAVQNMNIMMGFDEKQGVLHIPLSP
ncbi:MAG: N-acetyl-gamma-glutamyl-phosphate reductase [Candidatus Thermoplasmatota archaeon]